jgi:hypothetical protein
VRNWFQKPLLYSNATCTAYSVAATAVAAAQPAVLEGLAQLQAGGPRHFCLLGLDLLIDDDMRVWLLEAGAVQVKFS